jgi:hypothetical protein
MAKNTRHKKLTDGQKAMLGCMIDKGSADFYELCQACGTTARPHTLVQLDLAAVSDVPGGGRTWTFTEAGRRAFSKGTYYAGT